MNFSYEELLEKYNLLLEENRKLKREITILRGQSKLDEQNIAENSKEKTIASVNKFSSPQEKIKLYRSFFRGREDVFARRWYSKNSDKSGYQPVCENEWDGALCDKKKYKCSACPNRKLAALTDQDIYKHLSGKDLYGRDVVGIYPMLNDETCYFLCADFDEENFKEDVSVFRKICEENSIPVSVEISRSGNGAHAWIFFSEPISAAAARKLGSGILTKAMEKCSIPFSSYDRFFPNQDTMPKGGFGNLVALPLQGKARKIGNSVFADENFLPYDDQWKYLTTVQKIDKSSVDKFVQLLCKNGDLGELISEADTPPWNIQKQIEFSTEKFPESIEIVRSNMLFVPKNNFSTGAINKIKRLAAFRNPDFYKSQAMRLSTYNKPRIICTADMYDDYIALPRGCEESLCDLLNSYQTEYNFIDKTNHGEKISVEFNGELRDEQMPAAEAMLQHNIGVLSATTAFGKTVIASYLIGERKINTLILVHTQSLMTQWQRALSQFLNLNINMPEKTKGRRKQNSPFGVIGAGKNTLNGMVDVAVMQSLVTGDEVKEFVRDYGMIIVDECHHVSAVNFEKILKHANAKFVYGLTATPKRQDGHQPIIFMQCGPIRYKVDAKAQAEKRNFEHYLIPRFTAFRSSSENKSVTELYKELAENQFRNQFIISDILEALNSERTPIVLTERREHVLALEEMLYSRCENVITLVGTPSQKKRRESLEKLQAISNEEQVVIIATGKYVGEGFDFPRLDTLFLALPISWEGKVAQYAGRLHRDCPGKKDVRIYDYVDIHVPILERMYQKRLKGYASIGYKIVTDNKENSAPEIIYNNENYFDVFCKDIMSANDEIMIVSSILRKTAVRRIIKYLSKVISFGTSVKIITGLPTELKDPARKSMEDSVALLRSCGVNIIYKPNSYQNFAIIDNRIVWYGNVSFLGYDSVNSNVLRLVGSDIAMQLKATLPKELSGNEKV